jgi:hypothetical protein
VFTDQRIAAVRSRLRSLQIDEGAAEALGRPCVSCIYYSNPVCRHLVLSERQFDVVQGKFDEQSKVGAAEARSNSGLCGPEALLFEPRISAEVLTKPVIEIAQKAKIFGLGAFVSWVFAYNYFIWFN